MKLKQTIKREETREIEIELPYFCRTADKEEYYKIVQEEVDGVGWGTIRINLGKYWKCISTYNPALSAISEMVAISEDEFETARILAETAINALLTSINTDELTIKKIK